MTDLQRDSMTVRVSTEFILQGGPCVDLTETQLLLLVKEKTRAPPSGRVLYNVMKVVEE